MTAKRNPKRRTSRELDTIIVKGAREHNLQNIDLELPKKKLIVMTGVSGSGKSSLAFDTIYAEGQRRYVESLSAYARQFIGQMEKPRYDMIRGLSPTIAIEQKAASRNPRSTVGTITEIYDYLRVLFARIGEQYCIKCKEYGIKPEWEVWHTGSYWNLNYIIDKGLLQPPHVVTLFFNWPGGTWSPPTAVPLSIWSPLA